MSGLLVSLARTGFGLFWLVVAGLLAGVSIEVLTPFEKMVLILLLVGLGYLVFPEPPFKKPEALND